MMATTADFNSGDSHPQGWARQDTAVKGCGADPDMLVGVCPGDGETRQVRRVVSGAGVLCDVEPLRVGRLGRGVDGGGGTWEPEQRAIEPLRYRTERGAALRYTLRARER